MCPADQYGDGATCTACPAGEAAAGSNFALTDCVWPCAPNTFRDYSAGACTACPYGGTRTGTCAGAVPCGAFLCAFDCPAHTYKTADFTSCTVCPNG